MHPRSFLCENAKTKQHTSSKKELCEIDVEKQYGNPDFLIQSHNIYDVCDETALLFNSFSSDSSHLKDTESYSSTYTFKCYNIIQTSLKTGEGEGSDKWSTVSSRASLQLARL